MATSCPLAFSNCGASSRSTALYPLELSTVIVSALRREVFARIIATTNVEIDPGRYALNPSMVTVSEMTEWLPSRLIPHRHRPRGELQPAHEPQVDMRR